MYNSSNNSSLSLPPSLPTVDIFNQITSIGLNGLFSIDEITFDAKLGSAALGKFSLSIKAKILGKSETLSISADVHDIVSLIVKPIVSQIRKNNIPLAGYKIAVLKKEVLCALLSNCLLNCASKFLHRYTYK